MLKPILIGSLFCAVAVATNIAQAARATTVPAMPAKVRDLSLCSIRLLPMNFIFLVVTNNDSARRNGPLANGLINSGLRPDFRTAKTQRRGHRAAPLI